MAYESPWKVQPVERGEDGSGERYTLAGQVQHGDCLEIETMEPDRVRYCPECGKSR